MLLDTRPPLSEKRLTLATRSPGLGAVLAALLQQWQFALLPHPEAGSLVLAEEGCLAPKTDGEILWLTTSRYLSRQRLALPLSLPELWAALETRFHKPPRNHIRTAVDTEVTVHCRGARTTSRLISLSDMGGRFVFARELVNGEEVVLEYACAEGPLALSGRVIYVLPRGELNGTTESEAGIIFDRASAETRETVRNQIIFNYLDRVRSQLSEALYREGLGFLDLPPAVRKLLDDLDAAIPGTSAGGSR